MPNTHPTMLFRHLTAEELWGVRPLDGFLACMCRYEYEKDWWVFRYKPGQLDNARWVD